jgi:hypothetical protein
MLETGVARSEASPVHPDDVVHVRYPRSISNLCVVVFLIFVVLILLITEVILPKTRLKDPENLPLCYGMLLVLVAISYLLRVLTIIRIDSQGVTAQRGHYSVRATTVPWNEIFSCDLVVSRSPRGDVLGFVPVFKDSAGNSLFPKLGIGLSSSSQADQRRVFRALKSRFRKLDPDPWEP